MIRVRIVAPSARTRRLLESQLCSNGMEIVGGFASVENAAEADSEDDPDAILIAPEEMPLDDLLESLQESGLARATPTVLLAAPPPELLARFVRSGVRGILPTGVSHQALALALEAAASGLLVLDPGESAAVSAVRSFETSPALPEPLTPREKEVLQLLAAGLGNKEIAARLHISEHTAKFHVASILGKLSASSRTEAVAIGLRRGLILL